MFKLKFKTESKKYQKWCLKSGYNSSDPITLLWYYNRKGKAIRTKNNGDYEVIIKGKNYKPENIIEYFKNGNNKT